MRCLAAGDQTLFRSILPRPPPLRLTYIVCMYITTVVIFASPRLTFLRGWRIYKSIRTHRWPQTFIQLLCFCFRSLCFLLLLPSFVCFFLHFLDKMNVLGKWQVACGNWSVWQVSVVGSNVKWRDSDSERLPHTCSQESNDACPANKFRPVGSSSSVAAPHVACGCTGSCSLQLLCCCCKLRNDVRFV